MVTITNNTWRDLDEDEICVTSSCNVTITDNTFTNVDPTADTGWKP